METVNHFIFQVHSPEVQSYYHNNNNIKIIEDKNCTSGICVIYFSSNEIYYPNNLATFTSAIINRDKFEWQNNRFANAQLHIFVRDIQKQWYIEGVSQKHNTILKLAEHLKHLSQGYKVFTIGSSAGGFAAILFGSLLHCNRVYAFNAQLNLNNIIQSSSPQVDPILFKHHGNLDVSKYYTVSPFLNNTTKYFYFQSANSKFDISQYKACDNKQFLHKIEFDTSNHGFPFLRHNLSYVLSMSDLQLIAQSKQKKIHPFMFSIKIDGLFKATLFTATAIFKRIKKKLYDEKRR